jgi:hypothetical protein
MSNSGTVTKPTEAASYPAFAALVTAIGGYKLFEPKIARIRQIKSEIGSLELGFRIFYQIPQYVLIVLTTVIFLFMLSAIVEHIHPGAITSTFDHWSISTMFSIKTVLIVMVFLLILGLIVYWNLTSRLLLAIAPIMSFGYFGSRGMSVGWHQASSVVEGPDKGMPLMIDNASIDRVARSTLAKMVRNSGAREYAAEPHFAADVKANIALFGCVMEAMHKYNKWPDPEWAKFFRALSNIQSGPDPIFSPNRILQFQSGQEFFERFRVLLDAELTKLNQPCPPDRSMQAAKEIAQTWKILSGSLGGNLMNIVPRLAQLFGLSARILDYRLDRFPCLKGDDMRPQLIKMLIRWKALPQTSGVFVQPFATRQAWLLFQEGALRALPEQKEITFHSTGQVGVARIASFRVVERVVALVEEGDSAEARGVGEAIGPSLWARLDAADFAFWSWASAAAKEASLSSWDKTSWRWKIEGNRLNRTT